MFEKALEIGDQEIVNDEKQVVLSYTFERADNNNSDTLLNLFINPLYVLLYP